MEPLVHLIIPVIILIAFFPKLKKEIIFLAPITLIPDLDILFGKRTIFHNILFSLFLVLVVFLVSRIVFEKDKKYSKILALITLFFVLTHLLLDIWGPGIALFYPFDDKLYSFDFNVYMSPATKVISYELNAKINPNYEASKEQKSPFFSMISLSLIFMLLPLLIILLFKRKREDYGQR